jgi:hypothetical protein
MRHRRASGRVFFKKIISFYHQFEIKANEDDLHHLFSLLTCEIDSDTGFGVGSDVDFAAAAVSRICNNCVL